MERELQLADFRISAVEIATNFALEVAVPRVESRSMPIKLITLLRQRSMVVVGRVSGNFLC